MSKSVVPDLDAFRVLVDRTPDSTVDEVELLFSHYTGLSIRAINILSDLFSRVIQAALKADSGLTWYYLQSLQRQLIFEKIFHEKPLEPYFAIISKIRGDFIAVERAGGKILPLSETDRWSHAIQTAKLFNERNPDIYCLNEEKMRQLYTREFNVADAAKRILLAGFEINYANGAFSISEDELIRIADRIESLRRSISGKTLAEALFRTISQNYDAEMDRYHLGRMVSSTGQNRPSSIPFGYLFQLAGKSIGYEASNPIDVQLHELKELGSIATDLATLYNVEPYISIEILGQTNETIISFIRKIVLFDSIFNIRQLKASYASKIIRELFRWIDQPKVQSRLGFTIDDYANVMEKLLDLTKSTRGPVSFSIADLYTAISQVTSAQLGKVLNVISRPEGSINLEYFLPSDATKADYLFWPLVRTNDSRVEFLDATCNTPAFYEALAYELRSLKIRNVDNRIGHEIEVLIHNELSQHCIPVVTGKYRMGGIDGECDAVVETPDVVIFLEFKKKSLTRVSMSGDSVQVLIDLFKSLIDSQLQLGGHEITLRKYGRISFEDGQTIELKGREIERLSITLLDFSGLQDRTLLRKFLNLMTGSSVEAVSTLEGKQKEDFVSLQESCNELYTQLIELEELNALNVQGEFFHCWFLSLPQLLTLLEGVSSPNEFKDNLWLTRSVFDGRQDFYHLYSSIKKRRSCVEV